VTATGRVRTAADVARGAAALLLLTVLVAGIPALLLTVIGLPHALPTAAELRGYLTRPDDGSVFLAAAAAIAWAGWAVFALSTAVEAAAAFGGRSRQLPGLAGVQRPAAHLVSAVAVLLAGAAIPNLGAPAGRPAAAAALHLRPGPAAPPPAAATTMDGGAVHVTARERVTPHPVAPAGGPREIVVRPRDTLWSLAERHSGDPLQWRALAAANYGRPQPDGRHLTDAHWIYPGWRLRLPETWPRAAHPRPAEHTRPAPETPPRPLPHPPPGDPQDRPPAAEAPPAAAAPTARPAASPGAGVPAPAGDAPGADRPAERSAPVATGLAGDGGETAMVAGLAGGGLLAAGLLLELRRRRRRQQGRRRPGQRIPLPGPGGAETESRLQQAADPAAANALRLVLRRLAEQAPDAAASVRAVELRPAALRLWLGSDTPPPAPWQPGPDPGTWTLDAAGRRELLADAMPALAPDPLPGLVTVGRTAAGGYLLWNLEAAAVTTVGGPAARTRGWLRTAALELATSPWSGGGWFELAVVDLDVPDLHRVSRYPSLPAALAALEQRAEETRSALTDAGLQRLPAAAARLTRPDDERLAPTLLITGQPADAADLARLQAAAGVGSLVLVAPTSAVTPTLALDDAGTVTITPLGLTATAQTLTPAEIDAVTDLFATAAAPPVPAGTGRYAALPGGDLLTERHLAAPAAARPGPAAVAPRPRRLEAVAPAPPADPPDRNEAAPPVTTATDTATPAPADRTPPPPSADPPDGIGATPPASPAGSTPAAALPPPRAGLEVCVLGPVTIRGAAAPLVGRALELTVMLALAGPAGIPTDRVDAFLGTGTDTPNARSNRRHEIVSRTRRALGPAAGGAPAVVRDGGVYRLHQSVGLDYHRLVALTDRGGRDDLRAALTLVRGAPLDGMDLPWFPNHGLSISNDALGRIIDAAETLAFLELDDGNPAAAEAAIRAGLRAGPDERLYQALMIVRGTDPAAVERAYAECAAALAATDDSPGEETVATYQRTLAALRRASA